MLVPLWLQTNMGYTATWAGYTTALGGVLAVVMSPIVPRLMRRFDARALVSFGVASLAGVALWRTGFASNASYWTIAITFLVQGVVDAVLLHPDHPDRALVGAAAGDRVGRRPVELPAHHLGRVLRRDRDHAVGQRRRAATTSNIAGALNDPHGVQRTLRQAGMTPAQALAQIERPDPEPGGDAGHRPDVLDHERRLPLAACIVWLAPKPRIFAGAAPGGGH